MGEINIFERNNPTYSINYTDTELKYLAMRMTGDVEGSEFEFGYDTVAISRTENRFLRWWGGFCADIAGWALRQNERYGDYYMILDEEYTSNKIAELQEIADAYN